MFWDNFFYYMLSAAILFFIYRAHLTTKRSMIPINDISTLKSGDILLARWYPKTFRKRFQGFIRQIFTGGPWSHVGIIVSLDNELYVITTRPNYCTFFKDIYNEIRCNYNGEKPKSIVMTKLRDELDKYKSDGGWVAVRRSLYDIKSENIIEWFKRNDRHFENTLIIVKMKLIQILFGHKASMNYYDKNNTGGTWCSAFIANFLKDVYRLRLPFDVHLCDPNHFSSDYNYIVGYDIENEIIL